MKNCLVLGSGRSGTSMLMGCLRHAGYYMGEDLLPAKTSNPKGFFEDREINRINEELLMQVLPPRPRGTIGRLFWWRHVGGSRWLAACSLDTEISCPPAIADKIVQHTSRRPFCFKDPRFCYTLPCWKPFLPEDTVFVCMFREPGRTAHSILRESRERPYLRGRYPITLKRALKIWAVMYDRILQIHRHNGTWIFVHYDQILNGSKLPRLEQLLETRLDWQFPEPALKRSSDDQQVDRETSHVYRQLCELSGYRLC